VPFSRHDSERGGWGYESEQGTRAGGASPVPSLVAVKRGMVLWRADSEEFRPGS
jgi:hypothetical protein